MAGLTAETIAVLAERYPEDPDVRAVCEFASRIVSDVELPAGISLTHVQAEIYRAFVRHHREHSVWPTQALIAVKLKKSKVTINEHCHAMLAKGAMVQKRKGAKCGFMAVTEK